MSIIGNSSDSSQENGFHDVLFERVDAIAQAHLNRSTSLHAVIADSVNAYNSAFSAHHGEEVSFDLSDSAHRAELTSFIHACAEAVEEPENPQFPVRR